MKKALLFLVIMLSSVFTLGQCPVEIESAHLHTTSGYSRVGIRFRNVTDKAIIGIRFSIVFTDGVGDDVDIRTLVYSGTGWQKTKAHKNHYATWDYGNPGMHPFARINVRKVMFEDGTTWETDDSKSVCPITNAAN